MLVLTRKPGQQIVLPECGIRITVLGTSGRRIRLGIEGPPSTAVHRAEVWQRMNTPIRSAPPAKPVGPRPSRSARACATT